MARKIIIVVVIGYSKLLKTFPNFLSLGIDSFLTWFRSIYPYSRAITYPLAYARAIFRYNRTYYKTIPPALVVVRMINSWVYGRESPQTETQASVGFKAGVKDYLLIILLTTKSKILISWQHSESLLNLTFHPKKQGQRSQPKNLLVHGQLCGLMDLPVLIVTKGDATTSRPLLGRIRKILLI